MVLSEILEGNQARPDRRIEPCLSMQAQGRLPTGAGQIKPADNLTWLWMLTKVTSNSIVGCALQAGSW